MGSAAAGAAAETAAGVSQGGEECAEAGEQAWAAHVVVARGLLEVYRLVATYSLWLDCAALVEAVDDEQPRMDGIRR